MRPAHQARRPLRCGTVACSALGLALAACASSGSPGTTVEVLLASPPAAVTATNGVVHVQVDVHGVAPSSVELLLDGEPLQELAAPYAWDWPTAGVPEGSHLLGARAIVGSTEYDAVQKTVVVDRTAPSPPAVSPVPSPTSHTPVVVSGTTEPVATVSLYDVSAAPTLLGTAKADETGAFATSLALPQGSYVIQASATDEAGNVSDPSREFHLVIKAGPPSTPVLAPVPAITNQHSIFVGGTSDPGTTVTVYFDGLPAGRSVIATAAGNWLAPLDLAEGTHSVSAQARDGAGDASPLAPPASIVVDWTPPPAPAVNPVVSPTNAVLVTLGGTTLAGGTVLVYDGGTFLEVVASAAGSWSVPLAPSGAAATPEGALAVSVVAEDAAGNQSGAVGLTIVVDRTPPAAPSFASIPSPTRLASFAVGGTAEAGSAVRLLEDGAQVARIVASAAGAWSTTRSPPEGTHVYTATATDAAGNTSTGSSSVTVVVDRTPPAPPAIDPVASPTRLASIVLAGGAEGFSTVRLLDAGALVAQVVASGGGAWSATLAPAEGTHVYTATATDAAGNTSGSNTSVTVVVDRTPPEPPVIDPVASPTSADPVPVTGAAEAGAAVAVSEGATVLATTAASSGGTWSVGLPGLPDGEHAITAIATDAVGNTSAASPAVAFIIDRTVPAVVARSPAPGASNVWSRDPITVTFSTAMRTSVPPGAVALSANGTPVSLSTVWSTDGRTLTIEPGELPDVPVEVTATLSALEDSAGRPLPPVRWSWRVPDWQDLGGPATGLGGAPLCAVAVDDQGAPSIAWTEPGTRPRLARWTGSSWVSDSERLPGGSAGRGLPDLAGLPAQIDPDGRSVFAWIDASSAPEALHVTRSGATRTEPLGAALNVAGAASAPAVGLDGHGDPVVAWIEAGAIHARRWSGTSWVGLGGDVRAGSPPGTVPIALAVAFGGAKVGGVVAVAWSEGGPPGVLTVRRYNR